MTDGPQGYGWWQASDLKWYPPERHPNYEAPPPTGRALAPPPLPADRPPPQIGTSPPQPWRGRQRRQVKVALIAAMVVILAIAGITGYLLWPQSEQTLPFTGLPSPAGVAVDPAGNLYVTDTGNKRVLKLAAGSSTQTVLLRRPLTSLASGIQADLFNIGTFSPIGVAVDSAGNLYVADFDEHGC